MGGNFPGWSFPDTQNQISSLLHVKLRSVLLTKNMSWLLLFQDESRMIKLNAVIRNPWQFKSKFCFLIVV